MTAFASASRFAPKASIAWTKVGRPVGIAETAMEMPSSSTAASGCCRTMPRITTTTTAAQVMMPSTLVSWASSVCSGDLLTSISDSMVAIRPISVSIPVPVTTMVAVPRVSDVFWKSMGVRSPSATSSDSSAAVPFAIGALSPVRAASWVSQLAERRMRPSAGTRSPASSWTMSPGTTSGAGICCTDPSRTTLTIGVCIFARASTALRAFSSCCVAITTLMTTRTDTMIATGVSPMMKLAMETAMSIRFIGSLISPSAMVHRVGGGSESILFSPWVARRRSTSAALRPVSGSTSHAAAASAGVIAYHAGVGPVVAWAVSVILVLLEARGR